MNRTKDKIMLELLGIIALLLILWIGSTVMWLFQLNENKQLKKAIEYPTTYENCLGEKVETKYISYTDNEEKSVEDHSEQLEDDKIYLGNFKITHYCACKKCCGQNAQGITASGKKVEEGKTIAVDPKVIKLGSQVYIDGYGLMEAQDTGSAIKGNIIDVYISDHNEALKLGIAYRDVYLVK